MIRLINRDTGGDTWVHESRLEEYLAAGHRLPEPPTPQSASLTAPLIKGGREGEQNTGTPADKGGREASGPRKPKVKK